MAMKKWTTALLLATLVLSTGCYRSQIRNDGDQVRQALLDMYTSQTMDNLIRARRDLPFVQLNYHDVIIQATDQYTGTLSNNQTFTGSRSLSYGAALAGTLMHTVGSAFTFGGTAQRQDLLSFKADPITDQDDIYDQYVAFAKNPNNLMVSTSSPPKEAVHEQLVRKCDGLYYYIPCSASSEFMNLVLLTTFQRGYNSARLFYTVTIKGTIRIPEPTGVPGSFNEMIYFEQQVPNANGFLLLRLPRTGHMVHLQVFRVDKEPGAEKPLGEGTPIDHLRAQLSDDSGFRADDLKYARGQFISNKYPAPFSTVDTTAKKSNNNLESIRANTSIVTLKAPLSP
jgi:hypothetical protein